jgi:hypothetical protein
MIHFLQQKGLATLLVVSFATTACGGGKGSSSPTAPAGPVAAPSPFTVLFRGDVADPTGDTLSYVTQSFTVAVPPDLLFGSIEVRSHGMVHFNAQLASGTFNVDQTMVSFDLDVDENRLTGKAEDGLGMDYFVSAGSKPLGSTARVSRWVGVNVPTEFVGTVPATFGSHGLEVDVPLSMLRDDGRMRLRVYSSAYVGQTVTGMAAFTSALDSMPDQNAAAVLVR